MGKVGHPAGLPATSYSTALVFLDQFAQGTGVNVRGLIKLLDDAVVLAKSHVSRSGVALDRQHHTVMGFVASFLQRVLCSALLVAETAETLKGRRGLTPPLTLQSSQRLLEFHLRSAPTVRRSLC